MTVKWVELREAGSRERVYERNLRFKAKIGRDRQPKLKSASRDEKFNASKRIKAGPELSEL